MPVKEAPHFEAEVSPQLALEISDLRTSFSTPRGLVRAVSGVSFDLHSGQTVGVVGESGSGKSVLARSIMGILPRAAKKASTGKVVLEGRNLTDLKPRERRDVWGRQISMVFQDPMTSLNPVVRIGRQLTEGIQHHLGVSKEEAIRRATELLVSVGIPDPARRLKVFPHELSGGMRQRVAIAIALACEPQVLIADEPTTALDVTIQRQILDLLSVLQSKQKMSMMLITHDLGVVAQRTDRVLVMYAGRVVESAPTKTLFSRPRHPYTDALLGTIPHMAQPSHSRLQTISGQPADLIAERRGCAFAPRCRFAQKRCLSEDPLLAAMDAPEQEAACFFPVGTPKGKEALSRNLKQGQTATGLPVSPREGDQL